MQKPQLDTIMIYYLAIQSTYDDVQIALMKGHSSITTKAISKMEASEKLMPTILDILKQSKIALDKLSFIAANQGPGPFTTLRVVITTINGLAYAKLIPLIGIDGLRATLAEWSDPTYPATAILLNAFGNDVYTLIQSDNKEPLYGVYAIDTLLEKLKGHSGTIRFIGNGAILHKLKIEGVLGKKAFIPDTNPNYCSLDQIAKMGYESWSSDKKGLQQLEPLYLKKHPMQQQAQ